MPQSGFHLFTVRMCFSLEDRVEFLNAETTIGDFFFHSLQQLFLLLFGYLFFLLSTTFEEKFITFEENMVN